MAINARCWAPAHQVRASPSSGSRRHLSPAVATAGSGGVSRDGRILAEM